MVRYKLINPICICLHFVESIVDGQYVLHIITFDAFSQDHIGYGDAPLDFACLLKVLIEVLEIIEDVFKSRKFSLF